MLRQNLYSPSVGLISVCHCLCASLNAKHSVRKLQEPLPDSVVKGNKQYYDTIAAQFASVSRDLQDQNAYRYARQISGGCQEYIEAASFEHYLTTASIISYEDAASKMKNLDADGPGVGLSPEDYLLGIYDMTGELMKFSITAMATNGSLPTIKSEGEAQAMDVPSQTANQRTVLTDMRNLRAALESLDCGFGPFPKDVEKKMDVMQASVEKVEKALYGLTVRGAERPKGWMPDTSDASRAVEVEG